MNVITRAQAEALLHLADALEACERVGAHCTVAPALPCFSITRWLEGGPLTALDLRLAVNALVPKPTGS